jgi:thiol:disulfide interchange protein
LIARAAALLFSAALACGAPAFAQSVKTEHAEAELISERAAAVPGDQFLGALHLDVEEGGWHVYWKNPGDSGLPPEIQWTAPEGVTVGEFKWPAPHAIPLTTLMNYGYEHDVVLPFDIKIPATAKPGDTIDLTGEATWLICLEICVPEQATLKISVPVEAALRENAAGGKLIGAALANIPRPITGAATVERSPDGFRIAALDGDLAAAATTATDLHFFPEGSEILHPAKQVFRRGEAGVSATLKASDFAKAGDQPLSGVIVAEAKDGTRQAWEVDAQPGAIPAGVADAAAGAKGSGGGSGGGNLSVAAFASLLVFSFLGGLVLNLMPCVLPVLSIKAAGLAQTAHSPKEARAHGIAYTAGVLVCFAAIGLVLAGLRLAGEQAGLGFQLQYPPVVAFFALVIFAIGLNLLGVFEMGTSLMGVGGKLADQGGTGGAFFTGLLAAFVGAPCVGPFMAPAVGVAVTQSAPIVVLVFLVIGFGLAAPLLLLSFTPALAKLLPKPGKWMATFRQVLAFPMFLTAVWLLWILAGQSGSDGVILVVAGATLLGFGIWLAKTIGGKTPGRVIASLVILAALIGPAAVSASIKPPAGGDTASLASEVGAEPWSPERVAELQGEGRVIFVDFTARWCATCQVNKRLAIDSAQVQKAFSANKVAFLVADWTNRDAVIAEELAKHDRAGVPLYLVYPASGDAPEVLPQILSSGLIAKAVRQAAGQPAG